MQYRPICEYILSTGTGGNDDKTVDVRISAIKIESEVSNYPSPYQVEVATVGYMGNTIYCPDEKSARDAVIQIIGFLIDFERMILKREEDSQYR